MYKIIFFILILTSITSCGKEDSINLGPICEQGDMWMYNLNDTFAPKHALDSFVFNQGAGYHNFYWEYTYANYLSIGLLKLPAVGDTIIYKNAFIKDFKTKVRGQALTYDNSKESVVRLINKGTYYLLRIEDITMKTATGVEYSFRACDLKMTDIIP